MSVQIPGEKGRVVFDFCWGKPPEDARVWKKVSDLGDTITRCTFNRRHSQRISGLSCLVTFRVRGEAPYVRIEAAEVGISVAERSLSIARAARTPLSSRPVATIGCLACDSIEMGLVERSRVLHGDPPLGAAGAEVGGPADSITDGGAVEALATVPFEPWCRYTVNAPASGEVRLLRDPGNDRNGCEAYRIDAGSELVGSARACRTLPAAEPGRPTERRSYRWELPQGLFTFDVDFVDDGKWLFSGRLEPGIPMEFPKVVEFSSVNPLPADRLRALVMLASSAELRPRMCEDLKHGPCIRCGSILTERVRVEERGVLGP